MVRFNRDFFMRPTLTVAQELLGQRLVFGDKSGLICETEAYIGENDPACHAAAGKTNRTRTMYAIGGTVYVYLIYGMYHCLNFVTEQEGFPAAVLIRAIHIDGIDDKKLNGPGKLCRYLGITKEQNGADLTRNKSFFVEETNLHPPFETTPRIGISKGTDKLWRFKAQLPV